MTKIEVLKMQLVSRARRAAVTTIVLHATAGESASGAISWLRKIGLSYHYVIAKDGTVFKCVPYGREAFHAGVSNGPTGANVNRYSIGISFANRNDGIDPYTEEQIRQCDLLIADLKNAIPGLAYLTTHYAIAPKRKTDPKGFPCSRVNSAGLQMWGCK